MAEREEQNHDRARCPVCRRLRSAAAAGVIECPVPSRWHPPLCDTCGDEWRRAGCHLRLIAAEQRQAQQEGTPL